MPETSKICQYMQLQLSSSFFTFTPFTFLFSIFGSSQPISKVKIGLATLPTERYKRNVIRGKLELVGKRFKSFSIFFYFTMHLYLQFFRFFFISRYTLVSMGGTTGLFVGASLLSFVEIFYYFIVRPYYTFRMKRK